jgi:hypothetical protein
MNTVAKLWLSLLFLGATLGALLFLMPGSLLAVNILEYRDTISDSGPGRQSNHTLEFVINTNVSPNGVLELTPPADFEIINDVGFAERNVELLVNGSPRAAAAAASPGVDQVEIFPGIPGMIRYTLAPDQGLVTGDRLTIKIGNHTSNAITPSVSFSTTTGTTTEPGDVLPIKNSLDIQTHEFALMVYDGGLVANAGFLIAVVNKVTIPNIDTTEEIPPFRFNGSPTSTIGGTTLFVEISLETDELAICRFSKSPNISYGGAPSVLFTNTGIIFHSTIVQVTPGAIESFYIRCIDDEGNFNTDDFVIEFSVNNAPTGTPNEDGDIEGDGTGSGNDGTGNGSGGGGQTGDSNGDQPEEGTTSGSGGSGGGGGGGSGRDRGDTAGGGFESTDAPFRSGDARVVITGFAYPNSTVSILVDGKIAQTTRAGGQGAYEITLDKIARGVYTFGVYAQGADSVRSSTFSTSFTVAGARTSALSNINIAPSIRVTPDPVEPGQSLAASGYALANSVVTILNSRKGVTQAPEITAIADGAGRWSTSINTAGFTRGTYQIRAKAAQTGGAITNFSEYTYYGVGQQADVPLNADLSRDGRVNLTDFSILLFWWNSDGGDSTPPADINRDGRVTLTDFSILLFNWSG